MICADPDVIVIGAGVSGTTAARALADKGFKVKVIESRARKGGRVFSDKTIFNYTIDFGAAWIHGSEGNDVYKLATDSKIDLINFDFDDTKYYSNCTTIDSNTNDKYYKIGSTFKNYITDYVSKLKPEEDCTVSTVLNDYYKTIPEKNRPEIEIFLNSYLAWELEGDYASKIENLSAKEYDLKGKRGGDYLIPAGYWTIFESRSVHENIEYLLSSKVISINQEENIPYVTLQDNSKHYAKYILVTVPLGVLKKKVINFIPELPEAKQTAINAMGFGTLEKIVVEFTQAFWGDEKSLFKIIEKSVNFAGYIVNLQKVLNKKTLIFLVSGDVKYYPNYYTAAEDELKSKIVASLQPYFPVDTEILIKKFFRTKWLEDPNTYGAYSSYSVNSSSSSVKEIAKPFNKLYFAGEHTSVKNLETVAGAYGSGQRAATEIIAKLNASSRFLKR